MNDTLPGLSRRSPYDSLKALPDHLVGEILDGELISTPRPASPHAHAASTIGIDVGGPFSRAPGGPGGPGGWWILDEPELHLHGDVVVPDLAGWRRDRMPVLPNVAAFELAPDWVCEVISPRTARIDRTRKMRIYGREGVAFLWLVDPLARTLEVFRREGAVWTTEGAFTDEEKVRAEPFGVLEVELARWWLESEQ